MVDKMMERVAILADLPVPDTVPIVREGPWKVLWKIRPGAWAVYLRAGHPESESGQAEVIHAPGYRHLVVHEFCHHAQDEAGENPASPEGEEQAYRIQAMYFRLFPEDFRKEWMP